MNRNLCCFHKTLKLSPSSYLYKLFLILSRLYRTRLNLALSIIFWEILLSAIESNKQDSDTTNSSSIAFFLEKHFSFKKLKPTFRLKSHNPRGLTFIARLGVGLSDLREHKLREKCQYSKFFWFVFSRIWTKYGDLLRNSPYSIRKRENTEQNNSE